MSDLRTEHALRIAACDSSLRKRVSKYFADAEELHRLRDKLKYPSERLSVVEAVFGKKLADMRGDDRSLAEEVAVEHNANRVIYFSEAVIGGRIDALDCAPLLREFHRAFAREIEKEIPSVREHLLPAYDAAGLAHEVEGAAPLVRLADLLRRAREHAEASVGPAAHSMESTFRFLNQ